jgi:hypothetical protein
VPGFNGDYYAYFNYLFPGNTVTSADLKAKEAQLNAVGITLHPSTSNDNIYVPGIGLVDVIEDAGGKNGKAWQPPGSATGGPGAGPIVPTTPPPAAYLVNPYTGSNALPTYSPYQFSDPTAFTNAVQTPTQDLIMQLLESEGSMNPAVVAQMKEGQKESALSMADQLKQSTMQNASTRGVSRGGNTGAMLGDIDAETVGRISKGYRDTDIAAAQTNWQDKLGALAASGQFTNQIMSQWLADNQMQFGVEQARAGEQGKQFQSEQAKAADEFARYLAGEQLGLTANDQAFAQWLASEGLTLNYSNASQLADQFNKMYQLQVAQYLGG